MDIRVSKDPVCGMTPNPDSARAKGNFLSYQGTDYFFCCGGCKTKFEADPAKYLKPTSHGTDPQDHNRSAGGQAAEGGCCGDEHSHHDHASMKSAPIAGDAKPATGVIYTCPMHPEVKNVGPGDCPICGMKLVPDSDSAPLPSAVPVSGQGIVNASPGQQQLVGVDQVAVAMQNIRQFTLQNADHSRQLEVSARHLNELSEKLQGMVEQHTVAEQTS